VRAARRPTPARSFLAGAAAAILILSGHPEISFFGIAFASLLLMLMLLWPDKNEQASVKGADDQGCPATPSRWRLALTTVGIAAISAFCLAAPMLLPFVEYLLNADCYKFQTNYVAYVPWQAIVYNLINPGFGAA